MAKAWLGQAHKDEDHIFDKLPHVSKYKRTLMCTAPSEQMAKDHQAFQDGNMRHGGCKHRSKCMSGSRIYVGRIFVKTILFLKHFSEGQKKNSYSDELDWTLLEKEQEQKYELLENKLLISKCKWKPNFKK